MRYTLLLLVTLLIFGLVGCAQPEEEVTEPEVTEPEETEIPGEFDVVVVGGGGAGLIAAIQAAEEGAEEIVVIEKMPFVGGSTLVTGRLGGRGSQAHEEAGADYSVEEFAQIVYDGGNQQGSWDHIMVISEQIGDALDWYVEMGYDLYINPDSPDRPEHASGSNHGAELVEILKARADDLGINVQLYTTALDLIVEDGHVVGALTEQDGEEVEFRGGAVILTTGEFGANEEMINEYAPQWAGLQGLQPASSQGDGHVMAKAVGAQLVGMDWMVIRHGYLPGATRVDGPNGGIYVNDSTERFVDEDSSREELATAMLDQPGGFTWWVLPEAEARDNSRLDNVMDSHEDVYIAGTLVDLAAEIGLDGEALEALVEGLPADDEFGREAENFADFSEGPFVAAKIIPGAYTTMGGVATDLETRVLDGNDEPIPGLYAAGGVTGMIGDGRSAGANHAQIAVFGRIAGQTAVSDQQ